MIRKTADVVIAGAGIVGAACADAFSRSGLRVTIVEPGPVGGAATAAGMGHIVVMDNSEAEFALARYSQVLWRELAYSLPPEAAYTVCGTIWVAADSEEMAEVHRKHVFLAERGVGSEILDARALAEAEPNLRPGLAGGLRVPADSVIYPPVAAQWLIDRARRRGAKLQAGVAVRELRGDGATLADGSFLPAGCTVNATGTWAPELTPGIDIRPRKGHLAITDRYPGFVHHQLLELGYLKSAHESETESVAFVVQPRPTGQVLVGSSRQFGVKSSVVDTPVLGRMLGRALEFMPALAKLSTIRTWTGFRAATADKLPLIGPCPERKGCFLATGHEGHGITASLGTAALLAEQIMGRPSAISIKPYLPSRFSGRPRNE